MSFLKAGNRSALRRADFGTGEIAFDRVCDALGEVVDVDVVFRIVHVDNRQIHVRGG